jgi:hypothetical protein
MGRSLLRKALQRPRGEPGLRPQETVQAITWRRLFLHQGRAWRRVPITVCRPWWATTRP